MPGTILTLLTLLCILPIQAAPTGRAFVTNERSNSLSVLDTDTLELIQTLPIGKRPRGIGLAPDGSELYIALSEENRIVVLDPDTLQVLRSFPAGSDPEAFAVHPNGHIYISNEDDARATVYDPRDGRQVADIPVGLEPEGVFISPDGKRVVVTSESTNMLHVIRVPEHDIIKNVLVGARPRAGTFNRAGTVLYASSEVAGEISRIDAVSFRILRSTRLDEDRAKPKDVLLDKQEQRLYVAGGRANAVFVLDPESLELRKRIPVGKRTWGLAMSADGSRLFTTDGVSGTVSVIDTTTDSVIKTIAVGKFPWGIVIDD